MNKKTMKDEKITVPNCPHLNQIENFENSFMVCTDCGVEVQQIYCDPPLSACDANWVEEQSFFKSYNNKQFEFIENCVRRDSIPDSCAYEIYDYYLKIKSKHNQKNNLNEVAAVAIYDWKKETQSHGRQAEEVCAITHYNPQQLFKCEKKRNSDFVPFNDVSSIIGNAPIEELGLKHRDRLNLQSISAKFQDNDCKPQSIASALVMLYILASGKKCTNNKIIKMFHISSMTLYRTKKKIQEKANSILAKLLQKNQ